MQFFRNCSQTILKIIMALHGDYSQFSAMSTPKHIRIIPKNISRRLLDHCLASRSPLERIFSGGQATYKPLPSLGGRLGMVWDCLGADGGLAVGLRRPQDEAPRTLMHKALVLVWRLGTHGIFGQITILNCIMVNSFCNDSLRKLYIRFRSRF